MTKRPDIETIGAKLDALNLWKDMTPYNFAVKPRGTVFPYFCTVLTEEKTPVKARLLMLEGWQTMHDFVRTRIDPNFGFYSSPIEIPHFEMIVLTSGDLSVFRDDTGYAPRRVKADDPQRELVAKILWEVYGVFLRVESDRALPLKFADERAVFARVEAADGTWSDAPLAIPDPSPHHESVSMSKNALKVAKDLPMAADDVLDIDMKLLPDVITNEPRPRSVYELKAVEAKTGDVAFQARITLPPEGGLREIWEALADKVLSEIVKRCRAPGEIRVCSGRVFRMLRPLCLELPFKLSLHDKLS